jgi:hypothetical protein
MHRTRAPEADFIKHLSAQGTVIFNRHRGNTGGRD